MARFVVAGHINWDVTLRVSSLPEPDGEAMITAQLRSGGGSAANVASALAGFGESPRLVGSVGDDEPGFFARRELSDAGVDLSDVAVIADAQTTMKYLLVDEAGEVAVIANDGANEAIGPGDVDPAMVTDADHLHLTSQQPATAERLADMAADHGVPTSFDPGRRLTHREYGPLLERVDVVFVNDREAVEVLAPREDDPAAFVAGSDRIVVLKHGPHGATVYTADERYHHPGFGIEPVDTTGAGDAFAAGFIATLTDGAPFVTDLEYETVYERALAVANACGAFTTQNEGARTAPDAEELTTFFRERGPDRA